MSQDGIRTDLEKVAAVRSWSEIENVRDLRRFLGFTSYSRKFIKDYARIVQTNTSEMER